LFDDADVSDNVAAPETNLPDVPEWGQREMLALEKEVLGFYLTSHPLAEHAETLRTYCSHTTTEAAALAHRSEVLLGGMLASLKFSHTKNPRQGSTNTKYVMFDLEDTAGIMRSIVWPEDFANFGHLIEADAIVALRGVVDKRPGSEEANLIVNEVIPLADLPGRLTRGVAIRLDAQQHGERGLEGLYEILRGYPGKCEVQLTIALEDGSRVVCACDKLRVSINAELRSRVDDLLGAGHVRLIAATTSRSAPATNGNGNYARAAARR
jgi:DNA polymerase-3 subunit alpha